MKQTFPVGKRLSDIWNNASKLQQTALAPETAKTVREIMDKAASLAERNAAICADREAVRAVIGNWGMGGLPKCPTNIRPGRNDAQKLAEL